MALLSRYPIDYDNFRSFQRYLWVDMPGAGRPVNPDLASLHAYSVWQALRLSSVSHWVAPVMLPGDVVLNILASHPKPPVFDGPEDFNGRRNGDEIRLILGQIDDAPWARDNHGKGGGLGPRDLFAVVGDLNADPYDGEARREAITALLTHPRVQDPMPESAGGERASALGGANIGQHGSSGQDTADWRDNPGSGNMRVDYVLPSAGLTITGSGVFWPRANDPLARLVWVDIVPEP